MFSKQKVFICGRICKSETRNTTSGTVVVNFSIPVENSYKEGGEWKKNTTWFNCVTFNPNSYLLERLKKGNFVAVEGRIEIQEYESGGETKTKMQLIVNSFDITLGTNKEDTADYKTKEETTDYKTKEEVEEVDNDDLPF